MAANPDEKPLNLFKTIWQSPQGFILSGFPNSKEDVEMLKESQYMFDAVVKFRMDPDDLLKRRRKLVAKHMQEMGESDDQLLQRLQGQNTIFEEMANGFFKELPVIEIEAWQSERVVIDKLDEAMKPWIHDVYLFLIYGF